MAKNPHVLQTADIAWKNPQTPLSNHFDDVYFSIHNGLEESRYVFLAPNHLEQHFKQSKTTIIGETGFGTGLNFLLSWQLFEQHKQPDSKLLFISSEKHPLKLQDLKQCLQAWPELKSLSGKLLEQYPLPIKGFHLLELSDNVQLLLLFGDSYEQFSQLLQHKHPALLQQLTHGIDAWFLDGFAPSKNADMWQQALFNTLAKLSHKGTTLSSFTAAGTVKRGLQQAGFDVTKQKGFGHKREMITATFYGLPEVLESTTSTTKYKNLGEYWHIFQESKKTQSAIIVGAGIAGCTTAFLLAKAGFKVQLIDKEHSPMQQASGNPQAVLFPKLSAHNSKFSQFNLSSFLYAQRFYQQQELAEHFTQCGLLELIDNEDKNDLLESFKTCPELLVCKTSEQASNIANTKINTPAIFYPNSGFIDTQSIATALVDNPNIEFIGNTEILAIEKNNAQWQVTSSDKSYAADAVILCTAEAAKKFIATPINSKNIRGQINQLPDNDYPELKAVVCQQGYICPAQNDQYHFGASFDLHNKSPELSQESEQYNLTKLAQALPEFTTTATKPLNGRVNFRCAATDYMPVVGPVPDVDFFKKYYQLFAKNAKAHIPQYGKYQEGLFINIAFGSRGFSSAPIAAALIRAYILQQPYPVTNELIKALHPARFLIKQLGQKQIC